MIGEAPVKRLNRRTRGERNKRRERYFIFNESYNCETESDILTDDISPSSTPSQSSNNNTFIKDNNKTSNARNSKTVSFVREQ